MTSSKLILTYIIPFALILSMASTGGSLPNQWWKKCKARQVESFQEYKNLMEGELKNKVVFIDFFME